MKARTKHETKPSRDPKPAGALRRVELSQEMILSPKKVDPKEVKENRALRAMKEAFRKYTFCQPSCLSELMEEYQKAERLLKGIKYTAKDVTGFSILLSQFERRDDFSEAAGFFLSALINNHPDKEFFVTARHLTKRINYLGYFNCKDVTVDGDLGEEVGRQNSGTIRMNGSFSYTGVPDYNEPGEIYHRGRLIDPEISWRRHLRKLGFKPLRPP